ncbi:hypothetical protein AAFF_G00049260 [Aldrovandia affinis]|uniref:Uncharacterized protein n=1 Tax=Aldrovandia affinis TaxID=143900 RepID=A0AAD7WEI0_9TELE|nr:hypothetical protein AAFF_G00049260 [Aldrovandia affinis]
MGTAGHSIHRLCHCALNRRIIPTPAYTSSEMAHLASSPSSWPGVSVSSPVTAALAASCCFAVRHSAEREEQWANDCNIAATWSSRPAC